MAQEEEGETCGIERSARGSSAGRDEGRGGGAGRGRGRDGIERERRWALSLR